MHPAVAASIVLAASTVPVTWPDVCEEDLCVFPPYAQAVDCSQWALDRMHQTDNDRYAHKMGCLRLADQEYWEQRYIDQYRRWYVWDDVRLAYEYTGEARLGVLRRLRTWLGEDAYYRGELPQWWGWE